MVHFDTNFLIQATVAGTAAHVQFAAWIEAQEPCNVSTIAWAGFLCGPVHAKAEALAPMIFPHPESFLPADATMAAALFHRTGRLSRSLADCMIAAVAMRCGAKLATLNAADFQTLTRARRLFSRVSHISRSGRLHSLGSGVMNIMMLTFGATCLAWGAARQNLGENIVRERSAVHGQRVLAQPRWTKPQ